MDSSNIDPATMREALLMASQAVERTAAETVLDANGGNVVQPDPEGEGYEQQPEPEIQEPEPVQQEEETPKQEDDDVSLDVSAMKDKRMRLNSLGENDLKAVLLAKRNPDAVDLLEGLIRTHGKEAIAARLGITAETLQQKQVEQKESVSDVVKVDPEALEREIEALDDQIFEHLQNFEHEEAKAARAELKAKKAELSAALKAPKEEPQKEAKAEERKEQEIKIAPEQFQRLYKADLDATIAEYPEMERDDSPLWTEMQKEFEARAAKNDPIVREWDVNSRIAKIVAEKLNLKPREARAPEVKQQTRVAPGPASAGSRSTATQKPVVDYEALKKLPAHVLAAALRGEG